MNLELKTPRQYAEEILADEEPYALKVAGELEEAEGDKALLDDAATCLKDDSAYLVDIAKSILAAEEQARGNAAKLREALGKAIDKMRETVDCLDIPDDYFQTEIQQLHTALAAPPRNCDVARDWLSDLYCHFKPPKGMREMPPEWVDAVMAFCNWLVQPADRKEVEK